MRIPAWSRVPCGLALIAGLAGCAVAPQLCPYPGTIGTQDVYVIDRGWHTEIGIPGPSLQGRLGWFRMVYPGARVVVFSYGKRTFVLAPAHDAAEYVLGPWPGPALIQTMGLKVTPAIAYGRQDVFHLRLTAGGMAALQTAIADDLVWGTDDRPRLIAARDGGASLFYAARSRYGPLHTCNGWTARMLSIGGLPVDDGWPIVFAGQVVARMRALSHPSCRPSCHPPCRMAQLQGGADPS